MLPGITYDVILEIAASYDIPHQIREIAASELFDADELLLSSSTREVQAITRLDGKTYWVAFSIGAPEAVYRLVIV